MGGLVQLWCMAVILFRPKKWLLTCRPMVVTVVVLLNRLLMWISIRLGFVRMTFDRVTVPRVVRARTILHRRIFSVVSCVDENLRQTRLLCMFSRSAPLVRGSVRTRPWTVLIWLCSLCRAKLLVAKVQTPLNMLLKSLPNRKFVNLRGNLGWTLDTTDWMCPYALVMVGLCIALSSLIQMMVRLGSAIEWANPSLLSLLSPALTWLAIRLSALLTAVLGTVVAMITIPTAKLGLLLWLRP